MMCVIMKAESFHAWRDVQYIRTMNKVEAENGNNLKQRTPESIFLSGLTEEHYYAATLGITHFLKSELDRLKLIYSYCVINSIEHTENESVFRVSVLQSA